MELTSEPLRWQAIFAFSQFLGSWRSIMEWEEMLCSSSFRSNGTQQAICLVVEELVLTILPMK